MTVSRNMMITVSSKHIWEHIPVTDLLSVTSMIVARALSQRAIYRLTNLFILEKNRFNAKLVASITLDLEDSKYMKELILEKNRLSAKSVARSLLKMEIWRLIWEFILVRSHLGVNSKDVEENLPLKAIWLITEENTPTKDHSYVKYATAALWDLEP